MSKYAGLFKTSEATRDSALVTPVNEKADETLTARDSFSLLFVDDEEGVLRALKRVFLDENYNIHLAKNAEEALSVMARDKIHLVISDYRMPGMTGSQLLKMIKQQWPATIRIMLTGHADIQTIMGAVNEGAVYKFITKPWGDEDLRLTVSLALQQYTLLQENKRLKEITKNQEQKIKNYCSIVNESRGAMGSILVKSGVISRQDLDRTMREKNKDEFISETIVRLGLATEPAIVKAMQNHLNVECVDLGELNLSPNVVKFLPRDFCERNRLIPILVDNKQIRVAMADPSDIFKCDNITFMTGLKVAPLIAGSSRILAHLKNAYGERDMDLPENMEDVSEIEPLDEIDIIIDEEDPDVNLQELIGTSEVPPIIRIVNAIISEAVRYRASDIHIEPKTKYTIIRYRIDGMLRTKIRIPSDLHLATISRIKILARMDISERRRPQDGRITVKSGTRIVDIRVSTMPTISGEKVVMRILDKSAAIRKLDELGVLPDDLLKVFTVLKKPQGMIISAGPTGSGKTTMLYSILNAMRESTKNFETIEDPVEYFLEEANQVFVLEKIGLSFASVLRATLRQDPDVILVGEIRDMETADVAFKAALTGHMVLSTLHTNNSIASLTRLIDMGVKPYLIASAIEGLLAQRLVRTACKYCKTEKRPEKELLQLLKVNEDTLEKVFYGKGCEKCNNTGYLGRTGIFEIFTMNDDFRHLISGGYKESELMGMARAGGMRTLIEDGMQKVKIGATTLDEIVRVIGPQTRHERVCNKCRRTIDAKFAFCPFCGSFKQDFCRRCMIPLEKEWNICPLCGSSKAIEQRDE
ncbi:MAG: Flp pilus assembly complex ATPase component TadA [Nitrospirae bacterium]|nr:Flp pilus assembly complex ATPase component TadA [Nitrospirota bacterium]